MSTKIDSFRGDYRFLSNFWPIGMIYEDKYYSSVEHAYQAAKTTDDAVREHIRTLEKAGDAKAYGQNLDTNLRPDWDDEMRIAVMTELVHKKFFHDVTLAKQLLSTGDAELIEGNTHGDTFFGVCNGIGENHLGKILMKVRAEMQADVTNVKAALDANKGKRKNAAAALGISERTLYRKIRQYNDFWE